MPATDVAFTFNPDPVLGAVKRIDDGFSKMAKGFGDSSAKMSNAVTAGILKAGAVVGALVGTFKGLGNVLKRMPEIGQVFGVAKDIFFKNFLFPIRKELLPLLQQLLDWVRDNRAMFVRWGAAVAKAVRVVVGAIKFMINLIQTVGRQLLKWMGLDSLEDFVSILQFKIATVIIFLRVLATSTGAFITGLWTRIEGDARAFGQNLLDILSMAIGDILGWVARLTEGFAGTFDLGGNLANIVDGWRRMSQTFKDLWEALFGGDRAGKWGDFFEGLGALSGAALNLFVSALTAFWRIVTNIQRDILATEGFQKFADLLANIASSIGGIFAGGAERLQALTKFFDTLGRREGPAEGNKTLDFVQGTVTPVSFPETTPSGAPANNTSNIINMTVQGGDAQEAAEKTVDALNRTVNFENAATGRG